MHRNYSASGNTTVDETVITACASFFLLNACRLQQQTLVDYYNTLLEQKKKRTFVSNIVNRVKF